MEVKELRIGNWVYCKNENGNKVGKICRLENSLIFADVSNEKDGSCHHEIYMGNFSDGEVDCVMPIEITEQMLLDNGFEFDKNKDISSYNKGTICLYTKSFYDPQCAYGGKEYTMIITDNLYFNKVSLARLKTFFVHELQNLYYEINKKEIDFKL